MTGGKTEVQKLVFETAVHFIFCVNLGLYKAFFLSFQLVKGSAEKKQQQLQSLTRLISSNMVPGA